MFSGVEHKIEQHLTDKMVNQLAFTGICVIPQVGTISYDEKTGKADIKFTDAFIQRIDIAKAKVRYSDKHKSE